MSSVKQVWSAFNRWRKRCWLSRVIILCLFTAFTLVDESLYPSLVGFASEATLADAEPRMLNAIYRSNRANAIRFLQTALVAKLDADGDGLLSRAERDSAQAIGLDPAQLTLAPLQVDLDRLVSAARRVHLVSPSHTARTIRKDAWRAAVVEAEEIAVPQRAQVDSMLAWWRLPDYRSWATWQRGLSTLRDRLRGYWIWWAGHPAHWIPCLLFLHVVGAVGRLTLGRRKVAAVVVVLFAGALVAVVVRNLGLPRDLAARDERLWYAVTPVGYLLLATSAVLSGFRAARRCASRDTATRRLWLMLGFILLVWGLVSSLLPDVYVMESYTKGYLYCHSISFLFGIEVPRVVCVAFALSGAGILAWRLKRCQAWAALLRRLPWRTLPHES